MSEREIVPTDEANIVSAVVGDQLPRRIARLKPHWVTSLPWLQFSPAMQDAAAAGSRAFLAYMLVPGFTIGFHAATLSRSRSSVRGYILAGNKALAEEPLLVRLVADLARAIRPEDGLAMANARGAAQLPHWSRLAMREYHRRGWTRAELAERFRCSAATVALVLQGKGVAFAAMSGARRLTISQKSPPNQFGGADV